MRNRMICFVVPVDRDMSDVGGSAEGSSATGVRSQ